ncbi:MAG TPA: Holliday junction resolvase RecU [Bacillota bacterium]|nr:Holliday junction resolvase RecU [Bacillota bacterium]
MNYPDGSRRRMTKNYNRQINYQNRGMSLEEDINMTNEFYLSTNKAVIHKKPTPIQVVNVHYPKRSAAVITEAYYQQASTTDYNGVYRGKYIDFEAKETKNKTSFPLGNVQEHQIEHMRSVVQHDGIAFFIIRFSFHNETFFLQAKDLLTYWDNMLLGGRKSIPYKTFQNKAVVIPFDYQARVNYLKVVDSLYFRTEEDER